MKKILVIGAGFLQSFIIKKAKKLGYKVFTVDSNEHAYGFKYADHHETIDIINKYACLSYAEKNKVDGVITGATDFGVLTTSFIAEEMKLPGLQTETALIIKNKYTVRKILSAAHTDDTDQIFEVTSDKDIVKLANEIKYPVMVKPCDGSGSRGVIRIDDSNDIGAACNFACGNSITKKAIIESFITGREYGAESFVYKGEIHILAIMEKWMTEPPYYAELGHAIPSGLTIEIENKIRTSIIKAIQALGIDFGAVNMDLIVTVDGSVHIIDVGARMGGNLIGSHIIPIGTGIDYLAAIIHSAVDDEVRLEPCRSGRPVATRILALDEGVVEELPDFNLIEKKLCVKFIHHLSVGYKINKYRTNLDGCGYVIAKGETTVEASRKAESAKQALNTAIRRSIR